MVTIRSKKQILWNPSRSSSQTSYWWLSSQQKEWSSSWFTSRHDARHIPKYLKKKWTRTSIQFIITEIHKQKLQHSALQLICLRIHQYNRRQCREEEQVNPFYDAIRSTFLTFRWIKLALEGYSWGHQLTHILCVQQTLQNAWRSILSINSQTFLCLHTSLSRILQLMSKLFNLTLGQRSSPWYREPNRQISFTFTTIK